MYNHILIATDGSELARKGVDHGLSLARQLGAKVTVLMATDAYPYVATAGEGWAPFPQDIEAYDEGQKKTAAAILDGVLEQAKKSGVEATSVHAERTRPALAITTTAEERGCSLIVMASHGRTGLGRMLLGSQTADVLSHSPVPVLVIR